MKKTLYLHIGTPKTATTSIQMFCMENQEQLHQRGYSYPVLDYEYPHVSIRRNGHFLVGWVYYPNGEENKEKENELWERGMDMVHREFDKYPNVILSDENIWHSSNGRKFPFWEKLMEDAKENDYQVKVIVYLRRQDGMANSWLSQQIKEGWNTSACIKWDSFQKKTRKIVLNYYVLLEKIAEVTGRENIIVRIFERGAFKGNGGTIYSDFLEAIGLEYTDDFTITEEEANKSLTGNSQEILRIVNSLLPDDIPTRALVRNAAQECERLKDPENNFVMFSKEEQEAFMARYEKANRAIAEEYLGQEEPLFSSKVKDGERWTPDNRFMYEDIIRFFGSVVIQQQRHMEQLELKINNIQESRAEAIAKMPDIRENQQILVEQIINQKKDIKKAMEQTGEIESLGDKVQSVKVENLILKNELFDLRRERDELEKKYKDLQKESDRKYKETKKELKDRIYELEQTSFWFRLRRKWRHITGQDKKEEAAR